MKHFNKGVLFGKLSTFKLTPGETNRLNIVLEAPNSMHGDPKIYAAAFGPMADKLMEVLKIKGNGASLRLQGIMGQYNNKDKTYNSFTVYKCGEYSGSEFRAVFILIGRVEHVKQEGKEWQIHLHISRPVSGRANIEEDLLLYTDDPGDLAAGQTAKLKGVIGRKEDYFTDPDGFFKPQVKEIEILETPEKGPF